MATRHSIRFFYDGTLVELSDVRPHDMVLGWLRETRLATGTKEGCNEGDCGACSVVLGRLNADGQMTYSAVNACILLMAQIDGAWLISVESLGSLQDDLHPIQAAMVENNATQCGFCTPGFVMMTLAGHLNQSRVSAETLLAGNLCRCTGYGGLIETARQALATPVAEAWKTMEAEARQALQPLEVGNFSLNGGSARIDAPNRLDQLLGVLEDHPKDQGTLLVAGATDVGLWMTKHLNRPQHIVLTRYVHEMGAIEVLDDCIRIGAGVTYQAAERALLDEYPEAREWFERLGSSQVRAAGTLGGNIANGSPIGDSPPLLIALGATLEIAHPEGVLEMPLEAFFIDYGKQDLGPKEVVVAIRVPRRGADQRLAAHKISKRFDQDISSVMAVFSVRNGIHRYAFGGMAGTPKLAHHAMASRDPAALTQDFAPMDDHRASSWYRMQVSQNLLRAFLDEVEGEV